jgi:hypothetical protein
MTRVVMFEVSRRGPLTIVRDEVVVEVAVHGAVLSGIAMHGILA